MIDLSPTSMQSSMCSGMIFVTCSPSSPSWAVIPKYSGTFHSTPSVLCALSLHLWRPSEISALYLCMDFHPCWLIPKLPVFVFTHSRLTPFVWKVSEIFLITILAPSFLTTPCAFTPLKIMVIFHLHTFFFLIYLFSQFLCCRNIFQKHKLSSLVWVGIEFPVIWMVLLPDNWNREKVITTWKKT